MDHNEINFSKHVYHHQKIVLQKKCNKIISTLHLILKSTLHYNQVQQENQFKTSKNRRIIFTNKARIYKNSSFQWLGWIPGFLKLRGWHLYAWVFDSQNHLECSAFYTDQFHI